MLEIETRTIRSLNGEKRDDKAKGLCNMWKSQSLKFDPNPVATGPVPEFGACIKITSVIHSLHTVCQVLESATQLDFPLVYTLIDYWPRSSPEVKYLSYIVILTAYLTVLHQ